MANEKEIDSDERRAAETDLLLDARFNSTPEPVKRGPGRPPKAETAGNEYEMRIWHEAALTAMRVFEIKHVSQLPKATEFADAYFDTFKKRFNK